MIINEKSLVLIQGLCWFKLSLAIMLFAPEAEAGFVEPEEDIERARVFENERKDGRSVEFFYENAWTWPCSIIDPSNR